MSAFTTDGKRSAVKNVRKKKVIRISRRIYRIAIQLHLPAAIDREIGVGLLYNAGPP